MDKELLDELIELAKLCKVLEERSLNINTQTAQVRAYLNELQEKLHSVEISLSKFAPNDEVVSLRKQLEKLGKYLKSDKVPSKNEVVVIAEQCEKVTKGLRRLANALVKISDKQKEMEKDLELLKTNDSKIQNWLSTAKNVSWLIAKIGAAAIVITGLAAFYFNYLKGD